MAKKKVAFVTGGSGGIGKSICLKLIKSGFYVAVGYKTNKKDANNLTKKKSCNRNSGRYYIKKID